MKGFGTDETTLIDVLCKRSSQQRQEITLAFKTGYGKDLLKNLKDELRGNTEMLFKALVYTRAQLEAHDLHDALDGMGTNEASLIDIVCTKSNAEMIALKNAYRQMYGRELEHEVGSDASGYFKRFLVSLITANRSENPADPQRAAQLANELYSAGEKRLGTNEMVFNRIFAAESFAQLRLVFDEYYRISGKDIESSLKSEMSGDVERAFLAVARTARNPPAYWAKRLHETMAGAGTHDRSLVRIVVTRSEIDLQDAKMEFQKMFGKTLESFIKSDCSGDYKRALLCLAGDSNWR
jgi:annexin A7/11